MKPESSPWYLYIVRCADDTLYAGVTTNLARRIREHNKGARGAKYTRSRRPVKLVYCESFPARSPAQIAESAFKKLTRAEKERVLNEER